MTSLPFDYVSETYQFFWGWPSRVESAASVALRLQRMVRLLAEIDPAYEEMWPFGVSKKVPGPVFTHSVDDLALQIDLRTRSDPPPYPAPVGWFGYFISVVNNRRSSDPFFLRLMVHAGSHGENAVNAIELDVQPNGPLWQDERLMLRLFEGAVEVWDARWGAVFHRQAVEDDAGVRQQPRLAWAADGLNVHPSPPYAHPYPRPFPFESEPTIRRYDSRLGGEMEEWR